MADFYRDSKGYFDRVKNIGSVGGTETRDYNEYLRMGGTSLDSESANPGQAQQRALDAQRQQQEALLARQKAEEAGLVDEFTQKVKSAPSMSTRYGELGTELGIPQVRQNVSGLGNAVEDLQATIFGLPENVRNLKRGFDVNADRLKRIIESRSEPVRRDLIEMSRQYGKQLGTQSALEEELGRRLGFEREDFTRSLMPLQTKASLLSDRLAREFTGFSDMAQKEFSLLLDKIQGDRALSMAEMQRANDLADKEEQYLQEKNQLQMQYDLQLRNSQADKGGGSISNAFTSSNTKTETKPTIVPFQNALQRSKQIASTKAPISSFYK